MKLNGKIAALSLVVVVSTSVMSDTASTTSIKSMMQKTGAGDMGVQVMSQMIPALQGMIPDAPAEFWDDMMKEVDANELENLVIPVYQKHFTEEDIQQIIAFYETPVGQKFIKAQPAIMQESMQIGQQWGAQLAEGILKKYEERSNK